MFNGVHPTENYLYDIAGNLYQFTNRNGNIQTFTYDARNRETNNSWDDGVTPSRTLTYDDASRITSCVAPGSNINFTYFADDRLKSQEEWTGYFGDNTHRTLNYTYDEDGNRALVSLPGLIAFTYDYSNRNQLLTVTQTGNNFVYATYGYDVNGNMSSRKLLNGITSSFTYDAVNRVTDITHPFTNGSKTFHYGYDAVGNRTTAQRNGGAADSLVYDKNSQLTTFTPGGGSATSFALDAAGNRSSASGTSYSINNLNEYTLVGGHAASYDNNGNVLSRYDASGTQWTYTYDAMNRLTNATNGATTRDFYYDGLDRQVARSGTALPATFSVWDGWDLYAEYGFQAAVGSPIRTTIHGAPGDLIQQNKSGFANTNYYPDGLGSTTYLASGAGAMLEQYTYDAYGTPTIYNASGTIIGASAYAADHFFTGRQWHAALGLYDNRHRFYAPDWGRFLQPDPIGFSGDPANLYRYCGNDPVNRSDPFGLWTVQVGVSFSGQYLFGGGTVTFGYAFDGHGNFGSFKTIAGGVGPGAGWSGGLTFQSSPNADTIGDLRGPFFNATAGINAGIGGSIDTFSGTTSDGRQVQGGGFTVGLGAFGGGYVGGSGTQITPFQPSAAATVRPVDLTGAVEYPRITVTGKPVDNVAPSKPQNLSPLKGPSGILVQAPANFLLWLTAFPDGLLSHILSDSPTAQELGLDNGPRPQGVSHDTGIGFDGNFSSPTYIQQARNP